MSQFMLKKIEKLDKKYEK
jgi:hypothetical protein